MNDVAERDLNEEEEVGIKEAMGLIAGNDEAAAAVEEGGDGGKKKKKKKKSKSESAANIIHDEEIARYHIKGSEKDWEDAVKGDGNVKNVQIKTTKERNVTPGSNKRSKDYFENEEANTNSGVKKPTSIKKKKLKKGTEKRIRELGGLGD